MNWQSLNFIDYSIIAIIVLSSLISLVRGFVREAISLASWVVAFYVAITFTKSFSVHLEPYIHDVPLRTGITFFILFAIILIIGAMINFFVASILDHTGLSGTDRVLGIVFGFGRGILIVALLLLLAQLTEFPKQPEWKQSQLISFFDPVVDWLKKYLPKDMESLQPVKALNNSINSVSFLSDEDGDGATTPQRREFTRIDPLNSMNAEA